MPKEYRFSICCFEGFIGVAFSIRANSREEAVVEAQKAFEDYEDYGVSLNSLPGHLSAQAYFYPTVLTVDDIADEREVTP